MLTVIKPGNRSKIPGLKFECTVCGCIFIASKGECLRLHSTTPGNIEKFFHDCPTCGCEVKSETKREDPEEVIGVGNAEKMGNLIGKLTEVLSK